MLKEQSISVHVIASVILEAAMTSNSALKTLHTALIDARKGYITAYNDAEIPAMKSFFQSMMKLHEDAHSEVHAILARRGEASDEGGSFMAAVHETVISVRAAVVGLDQNSLDAFANGEERIIKYYNDVLADESLDGAELATLKKRRNALAGRIAEMKRKAA
jgi:uncharacterized protein (TIGR02284 family)